MPPPLTRSSAEQATTRERRQLRNQEIRALFGDGMPIAAIARHLGLTRPTVRRSLETRSAVGEAEAAPASVGVLTPYELYLWQRWQQGCRNAKVLWQEIRVQGYVGSYAHLRLALSGWRTHPARRGRAAQHDEASAGVSAVAPLPVYSPRQATSLLLKDPADCPPRTPPNAGAPPAQVGSAGRSSSPASPAWSIAGAGRRARRS